MTADRHCPEHGVETVALSEFARDALSYTPGDTISGRYRITGTLGKGGFGAVYAAEHVSTLQEIAVKILSLDPTSSDDDVVKRFFKEAQITARLSHPNTVRVFDVGQAEDGPLFLAMEMLRGPTLEQVLKHLSKNGRPMSDKQALDVAIPVLKSMTEAHKAGLVHRDLKPANIMMAQMGGDEPVVKVLDFGCARTQDSSLTAAGTALGTPQYMSPEQCMGEQLDGRSDLYSLGVIMYRCVVGKLPFTDKNPLSLMYMHTHLEPPDPATAGIRRVHPGLAEAIRKTLSKSRDDRYADAKAMRTALEEIRKEVVNTPAAELSIAVGPMQVNEDGETVAVDTTEAYGAAADGDTDDVGTQLIETGFDPTEELTTLVNTVSQALPKKAQMDAELRKSTGTSSARRRVAASNSAATMALDTEAVAPPPKKSNMGLVAAIGAVLVAAGIGFVALDAGQAKPAAKAVAAAPAHSDEDKAKARMLAEMAAAEADLARRIELVAQAAALHPEKKSYGLLLAKLNKQKAGKAAEEKKRAAEHAAREKAAADKAAADKAAADKIAAEKAAAEKAAQVRAASRRAARKAPKAPKKAAIKARFLDDDEPAPKKKKAKSAVNAQFMD